MKRNRWIVAALIGLSAVTLVMAQVSPARAPAYNPKSELVLKGTVAAVAAVPDWMGKDGVNITLQTPDAVLVHVDTAPAEFLKMLDFAIGNGDALEVTGVWSHWDGDRVFLARTVSRHRVAISVRDPEGKPVW